MALLIQMIDTQSGNVVAHATIDRLTPDDQRYGDYDCKVYNGGEKPWKQCIVAKHDRVKRIGWDILCRGLYQILADRNFLPFSPSKST